MYGGSTIRILSSKIKYVSYERTAEPWWHDGHLNCHGTQKYLLLPVSKTFILGNNAASKVMSPTQHQLYTCLRLRLIAATDFRR